MNENQVHKTKEHRFIEAIKDWTGEHLIGDDCAVLPGGQLVTADSLVQGVHFLLPGIAYKDLGWKAMAVNLSDLAAMSGRPRFAIVSLTLPENISDREFELLFAGMIDCARDYRCRIVGGDLTRGPILVISVTIIGDQHEAGTNRRSSALPGDVVISTGDFGASAAGLWLTLNDKMPADGSFGKVDHCLRKHFHPLPRLTESWQLVSETGDRAALMDASDGLADALWQLSVSSNVGMVIDADAIPIHDQTRKVAAFAKKNHLDWALYGGEDYELVACLPPDQWQALEKICNNSFKAIGRTTPDAKNVVLQDGSGRHFPIDLRRSFQHWL